MQLADRISRLPGGSDKKSARADIDIERPGRDSPEMSRFFLVTYHCGGMPEGDKERQQAMAAFGQRVSKTGKALVDRGVPLGPSKTVSNGKVTNRPAAGPSGAYSVIQADDIEAEVDRLRSLRRFRPEHHGRRPERGRLSAPLVDEGQPGVPRSTW